MGETKHLKPWQFKKGHVANPNGARSYYAAVKKLRRLSADELARLTTMLLDQNLEGLNKIIDDPTTTVMTLGLAKLAKEVVEKGNVAAWECLINRICGKPKEDVKLTAKVDHVEPVQVVLMLPGNGLSAREKEANKYLLEKYPDEFKEMKDVTPDKENK